MAKINFGGVEETVVTREEFPLEKAKEVLKNETIAVIGYGIQGPGQGLNLRDNGFNVIVGQRKESKTWDKAVADGWIPGETLFDIEEAAERATIIEYLLSDAAQIEVRLYSSVFAIGSVKCHEDHIRCLTQLDYTRTEEFSSACYRILYLIVKAADIRCLRIYIIISIKSSGRICTFLTEKYIHKNRLMSLRTKCLTHICSRYNRNLTFCAGSSCQYYNLHLFSPTLSFQTYFSQSPFPVTD